MTTRILVTTSFDCTDTGVTGHFKSHVLPLVDRTGLKILDQAGWERARNQQRNWETIMQIVGLYTQPQDMSATHYVDNQWQFEYSTEFDDVFLVNNDPLGLLKNACRGVPMVVYSVTGTSTSTLLAGPNIWFSLIDHK